MPTFEELKILDFDHLEFAVTDLDRSAELYLHMGFEKLGVREVRERQLRSYLMGQNGLFVLLSQSQEPKDPVAQHIQKHGDGVLSVAFRCEDAAAAVDIAARRGATVLQPPRSQERDFGSVTQASIAAFGDIRHMFISRTGTLFADGFDTPCAEDVRGSGLLRIDHLSIHIESGQRAQWQEYYQNIFGLEQGLVERTESVMESRNGKIRLRLKESSPLKGAVQDFLDIHHGPGVQKAALETQSILPTLQWLRGHGVPLVPVPASYYETLATQQSHATENAKDLRDQGVQIVGDDTGYLLHAFTQNVAGAFFYEILQRKGFAGFGDR